MGLRPRLTYANVMATIAVFIALGGSSYAAISVTGKNVKNSSLTGTDVKNNSLTGSDVKSLGSGDVKDRSLLARDFKPGQLPAGPQGPKGDPASLAVETTHTVGAAGEPAFENGWTNFSPGYQSAAFYKDPLGIVHIEGVVKSGSQGTAFTLPPGYRPNQRAIFPDYNGGTNAAWVGVDSSGTVEVLGLDNGARGLDGITFRAGS